MTRTDIINHLIKTRGYKSYLEIGVQGGINFDAVEIEYKIGVDPDPTVTSNYTLHSDIFFYNNQEGVWTAHHTGEPMTFDLIFIDGLHHSDQVLKDIYNSSKILNPGGIIVVHDANPQEEAHQLRDFQPGTWNGDVWKALAWLQAVGVKIETVDTDQGCALIEKQEIPDISEADLSMEWDDLVENRQAFLNLISVDKFKEKYI